MCIVTAVEERVESHTCVITFPCSILINKVTDKSRWKPILILLNSLRTNM